MEEKVCKALNYKFTFPTAYTFLRWFLSIKDATPQNCFLSELILELTLQEFPMFYFRPSLLAAAAYALSRKILLQPFPWPVQIEELSSIKESQFLLIQLKLLEMLEKDREKRQKQSIFKFSTSEYHSIATLKIPINLKTLLIQELEEKSE